VRNAKIVCTLGPASCDPETVGDLIAAGMDVARLNASHGSTAERRETVETVRSAAREAGRHVAVLLDLQGPEVRTADADPVDLDAGSHVDLVPGDDTTADHVGVSSSLGAVSPGDRLLLDDGRIETTVEGVEGDTVTVHVDSGGTLESRSGVNVPGVDLGLDPVTDADREELALAAELDLEFVAASFVRDGEDVYAVDAVLEDHGSDVPVVAKVERADAVENAESIVAAADGVMVARGDLGVECPLEQVPLIQKRLVRRCLEAGVPVITATEMLDSMVHARRPTRAEASDVANAVLDGTDAVMLSAETAVGDHPVRVVEVMTDIVRDVESSDEYAELREQRVPAAADTQTDALARSARYLARDVDASAVVTVSESGYTAGKVAKYRPAVPVVVVTTTERVACRLALTWGVQPRRADLDSTSVDDVVRTATAAAVDSGAVAHGETLVVLSGMVAGPDGPDATNTLKVHRAAEVLAAGRAVAGGRATGPLFPVPADGDLHGAPTGAVLRLDAAFDGEFDGDLSSVAGLVHASPATTSYPAVVARELGVPMVAGADLSDVEAGRRVVVDGDRGVVYDDASGG
jgi:pyruvate kinase